MAKDFTITLDRFRGLDLPEEDEKRPEDGFCPRMKNFRITPSGGMRLREGFRVLQRKTGKVRCLKCATLTAAPVWIALIGQTLYVSRDGFETLTAAGTIPGEDRVSCLEFGEKLCFLTGDGFLTYDGEALAPVSPYRPLIRIASPPSGGGTVFEDVNLLTAEVRQTFSPDGHSQTFRLAERQVNSIDYVLWQGQPLTEDVHYEAHPENGTVLIYGAGGGEFPEEGVETVEIGYTLTEHASEGVEKCRFGVTYGGENDTRAFLYGNPAHPAVRYYSGIVAGLPSIAYFPASHYSMVGDGEKITSIVRHYDRQIIFTPHAAYFSYPQTATDQNGMEYTSFPVYTLSAMHGNITEGLNLLLNNKPLSVMSAGLWLWTNTSIRDERNSTCFSERIKPALAGEDLTRARFFYRSFTEEMYIILSREVYVYHTRADAFYSYGGFLPTEMAEDEQNRCFFGTADGKICLIGGTTDDGEGIEAEWESGAIFCADRTPTNNLHFVTAAVSEETAAPLALSWTSDKAASRPVTAPPPGTRKGRLCTFTEPDFGAFSFESVRREGGWRWRIGAKRFSHISLSLFHPKEEREGVCITHLILQGRINDKAI